MEQEHGPVGPPASPHLAGQRWVSGWAVVAVLCSAAVAAMWGGVHLARTGQMPDVAPLFLGHFATALLSALMLLWVVRRQVPARLRGVIAEVARLAHEQVQALVVPLHEANRHLREQLAEQRHQLRTVSLLEEVVVELDAQLAITQASDGWPRVLPGVAHLVGKNIRCLLVRDEDLARLCDIVRSFELADDGMSGRSQCLRFLFRGEAQRHRWIEFRVLPRWNDAGRVQGYLGVLQDVTQRQDFEVMVAQLTLRDPLTGLPNRALLEDRLRRDLKACQQGQGRMAVLSLDIDNFKSINDALGHKTGDRLLIALGQRLLNEVAGDETVARWSGDEFSLVWPNVGSTGDLAARVEALQHRVQTDYSVLGAHIALTTSLGVALFPDDGESAEELLSAADRAKTAAKAHGRNQVVWAEELRGRHAHRQTARMRQRLMKAVERGEVQAWFQPIVRSHSRDCDMVEVLARWHDPELGWVSPDIFIPMAEESGLIAAIGQSIWLQAARQQVVWRAQGLRVQMAVNVSIRQLHRPDFAEQLLASLQAHGVPANAFVLEITESAALQDVTDAPLRLQALREAGFQLALDDFGTGYASLSQLHDMPINELKIDISFVRRLNTEVGVSMIAAIVKLAEVMGLQTIAEGVETADAADQLELLGVTRLQGHCFGQPMTAQAMGAWLVRETQATVG